MFSKTLISTLFSFHFSIFIYTLLAFSPAMLFSQTFDSLYRVPWNEIEYGGNVLWSVHYNHWAYRINMSTGTKIDSVFLKIQTTDVEGRGIAWDGNYLWYCDFYADSIYKLNPTTGYILQQFRSPGGGPQGLAWGENYLWHTDEYRDTVYKISPTTGQVVKKVALPQIPGFYIGVAYLNGKLWLTNFNGSGTDSIFQLDTNGMVLKRYPFIRGDVGELTTNGNYLFIGVNSFNGNSSVFRMPLQENVYTVTIFPSMNTILLPGKGDTSRHIVDSTAQVGIYMHPNTYKITATFHSPRAGGNIDGVFFFVSTGGTPGQAMYRVITSDTMIITIPNVPGYIADASLFFIDRGNLNDNSGRIDIHFIPNPTTNVTFEGISEIPITFQLKQNYPNPFNPSTRIEYGLSHQSSVEIKIYNSLGQVVRNLVNEFQYAGTKSVIWDGKNDFGGFVSSGTYFYQIKAGDFIQTKKMLLIK